MKVGPKLWRVRRDDLVAFIEGRQPTAPDEKEFEAVPFPGTGT